MQGPGKGKDRGRATSGRGGRSTSAAPAATAAASKRKRTAGCPGAEWDCPHCTFKNMENNNTACGMCGRRRPVQNLSSAVQEVSAREQKAAIPAGYAVARIAVAVYVRRKRRILVACTQAGDNEIDRPSNCETVVPQGLGEGCAVRWLSQPMFFKALSDTGLQNCLPQDEFGF